MFHAHSPESGMRSWNRISARQTAMARVPVPRRNAVLLLLISLCVGSEIAADDWTQFRGKNATGVAGRNENPPTEFSTEKNVAWSVELGKGVAGPIISGNRVFTTMMTEDGQFAILAFDAATGEELWSKSFEAGTLPEIMSPNQHASSTPATDGKTVFVHFSTIGLIAVDAATGEHRWTHKLPEPFYLMGWGAANSPIVYQDMVIFNLDDDLNPYLIALDTQSGSVRWRTPRPEMLGGYAVPVLCTAGGRTDIVVAGSGKQKGYDPANGQELWTCNSLLRTIMTTPVVYEDRIHVSVQSYGDTDRVLKYALLQWRDTNQDGKLAKSELESAFAEKFDRGDANKDGFLEDDEIDAAFQAQTNMVGGGNIIQSIRGGGRGDVTKTHMVWNLDNKSPSNIASPLIYDGRLFVVKKGGISASFNVSDGSEVWSKKRIRNFGNYYASPVAAAGRVYVPGENGNIVVLKSGPALEILERNDVGDSIIATPAIANNRFYVRTLNKLYCFAEKAE